MIQVALIQMCATGTKEANLSLIRRMVGDAVEGARKPDVVCLPEYCYGVPTADTSRELAESIPGNYSEEMAKLAERYKVNISAGSFSERGGGQKIYNASLFFNRRGEIIGKYRKTHLMNAMNYRESDSVLPGDSIAVFDTDFGRVGLMVCYDLRFPELARTMTSQGAEIIFVPSAFPSGLPLPPRTDHWDVLTKCTALLNSVYVVATNQFGHDHGENYFGRSSVIDPWGTRTVQATGRQGIIYGTIDLEYEKHVKAILATLNNRRPELYHLSG